ncbi:unnamed protein product (macronuclear) [Paramecium tetraurelia]|uniref:Uncharacterized protein n=1 Tax=Paramecium tetraurelia TaxID=5888 RepID=A0E0M9_PARTE|nr:uncharacterized protein GSPATT00022014001 [Paramecium tetraurelia]CAK88846.1 unnamed protein product [Paramecium tetraurelia]|eukprot:XP_001456243.1 hypothetical protein (macronuclear) [Paramecium tetraurelia strain d4-2]
MQNKLLDKVQEENAANKMSKLFKGNQNDYYVSMKEEDGHQIELNKIQRKKVFLSGSEDEEERLPTSTPIVNKEENKCKIISLSVEIQVYQNQENRNSDILDEVPTQENIDELNGMPQFELSPLNIPTGKKKTKTKKNKLKKKKVKHQALPFNWNTYKFLLHYPLQHLKLTILVNVLIVLSAVAQMLLPWILGRLIDEITKNVEQAQQSGSNPENNQGTQNVVIDEELHSTLSKQFLYVLTAYTILSLVRAFINQIWQEMIYNDMREDVLKSFLSFDLTFFHTYRNGEIISRMTNDLQSAKSAVSGNIILLIRNCCLTIFNIIILFALSWKVTLAILAPMPIFIVLGTIHTKMAKKFEKLGQEYQAKLTTLADEIVSGVVTVKSFCTEQFEIKKFHKQLDLNIKLAQKRGVNTGCYQASSALFTQLGSLIVLWYGGKLAMNSSAELSAGDLTTIILYSLQLSSSSSDISESFAKIVSATGAFEGVLDMLKWESLVKEAPDAIDHITPTGEIQFKNVVFSYPNSQVQVLKGISLKITKGEYVAFVGPSGSGKSTLMHLLERFYDPQSGSIYFDEMNIKQFKLKALRKAIGLVSQDPVLFEGTIETNIIYGTENYTKDDFEWATKAAGVWQFVSDKFKFPHGFDTFVGEHGYTLSGGQKQRIVIARALLKRPKILIFDEATSALDAESEFQVQSAIDELIQKGSKNITVLVIAHRLSTIVNCNRIIVLQNGVVAEQGTHQELLNNPEGIYRQLVERQISGVIDSKDNDGDSEAQ